MDTTWSTKASKCKPQRTRLFFWLLKGGPDAGGLSQEADIACMKTLGAQGLLSNKVVYVAVKSRTDSTTKTWKKEAGGLSQKADIVCMKMFGAQGLLGNKVAFVAVKSRPAADFFCYAQPHGSSRAKFLIQGDAPL